MLHHSEGIVDSSVVGNRFEVHVVTLVALPGASQQHQCQLDRTLDRAGQQESVEFADARVGERSATLRHELRAWSGAELVNRVAVEVNDVGEHAGTSSHDASMREWRKLYFWNLARKSQSRFDFCCSSPQSSCTYRRVRGHLTMTVEANQRRWFLQAAALAGFGAASVPTTVSAPGVQLPRRHPGVRRLDRDALEDILVGCSYLGCGGGGRLSEGKARIADDLRAGLRFELLPLADLGDDEWVASPYGLGSLAPPTEAERLRFADLPAARQDAVETSFRRLSDFLKQPFVAAVAGELGPWSTAAALSTAARIGIPLLDADRVGRATPEATQDSVLVAGLSNLPVAAVTGFGDSLILEKVARGSRVEDLLRAVSVASLGELGVTDAALSGRDIRRSRALVVGTISHAQSLGNALRRAMVEGADPIGAVLAAGAGYRLFEGHVVACPWHDEAGFLVGEVDIAGRGDFAASRYRVRFKNENIVSWRDDAVSVMPPDLIAIVDSRTGAAVANPDFEVDQAVTVLGFRAPPIWRTPAGLSVFGPAHFGLNVPYVPL